MNTFITPAARTKSQLKMLTALLTTLTDHAHDKNRCRCIALKHEKDVVLMRDCLDSYIHIRKKCNKVYTMHHC
jgi:hypothetical protein